MRFDPSRSTPSGYWRTAAEYLLAGRTVQAASRKLLFPALQMYGQSIELALKAFLLKRGVTLDQVEKMRHHLAAILRLARRLGMETEVKLTPQDVDLINLLSKGYANQRFRYMVTGSTRLPELHDIAPVCERLVAGLERYCTGASWGVRRIAYPDAALSDPKAAGRPPGAPLPHS